MTKYQLFDENNDLVRVFMSHEEAVKMMTGGDYLVMVKTEPKPKVKPYDYALKKVGEAIL